ncbi:hypothetical protein [Cohnella rhizosphaerae]|uniref:Uncharacterized protein n=1 Tax=Cohnella rhizosphaerae TaxID=1457232 RepID=A0A9X4QY95_9BACL|nr:hypothetical protein [Cohnella rhizosphaerae]MDG0814422.1 hypothetical protein [Cohnella rhizosphaerae]
MDNGYLGVFATFGLLGGALVFRAMCLQGMLIRGSGDGPLRDLGLIALVGLLASFFFRRRARDFTGGDLLVIHGTGAWQKPGSRRRVACGGHCI